MQLSMTLSTVNAAIFALRSTDVLPRKIRRAASDFFYARFRPNVGLLSIGYLQRM
jgi:hypothetical protein